MIEGDRYKQNHAPAVYPAAVGVSVPPRHVVVPVVAATPVLSHHDARREWRYERRAMRDSRRAARHGYGYREPIAIPVAYAPEYYEAGPSSSRALPERRRDEYWEDNGLAASARCRASDIDKGQREISPPKYEAGSWDPPRTTVEVLTDGKGT